MSLGSRPEDRVGFHHTNTNNLRRILSMAHRRREDAKAKAVFLQTCRTCRACPRVQLHHPSLAGGRARGPHHVDAQPGPAEKLSIRPFFLFWDYSCSPVLVSRWIPSFLRGHKPASTGLPAEWGFWASSPQLGSRGTRARHGESSRIQPDQMPLAVRTRYDTTYSAFVQTMKTHDLFLYLCFFQYRSLHTKDKATAVADGTLTRRWP